MWAILGATRLGGACSHSHGLDPEPRPPLVHSLFGLVSVPVVSYNDGLKPMRPAMPPSLACGVAG